MATGLLKEPSNKVSPDLVKDSPHTIPCPSCSAPIEPADKFCPNCGRPHQPVSSTAPATAPTPPPTKLAHFRCKNCGADVTCEPEARTTTCPFCASPYVIETTEAATGKREPEFVLGFEITPERAERIYREWISAGGLFRPRDIKDLARSDGLKGIYLPFWSFTMKATSRWSASIGEFWYRTETYTERDANGNEVVRTRQVQETEWWPLEGGHQAFYGFYPVSASKGLPHQVFLWVEPYQLAALKRFNPKYLSGWLTEDYSIDQDEARTISHAEFRRREQAAIQAMLPGDTSSGLRVDTQLEELDSDLILLPIYLRAYQYNGKLYRTLINGQTGKIAGEKPVSAGRIALFVLFWILLIAGIVLLVMGTKQ
jgi:hypothetical protein